MIKRISLVLLLILFALALAACGGGGGGGGGGGTTTYTLSGRVTLNSTGLPGVTVILSGASNATVITDGSGNYSFAGLPNGSYTVTPSLAGYSFNPANTLRTISNANVTGVNFTATPVASTHSISGTITASGFGLAGATVSIFGTSLTATTDVSGNYLFTGLADGPYTLTPSKNGYLFTPTSRTRTLSGADIAGVNFTASAQPSRVTVRLFTAGTTTLIGSLNMTLQLPAGVTVKSTVAPPLTDPGVAYQSGNAASSELFSATYSATTGTLFLQLGSTTGFTSGEFATIVCDVAPGVTPTPSDFIVLSFTAWDADPLNTQVIAGVTTSITVQPSPAHARLTLSTAGTSTTVAGVDVTIALPSGVTARSTLNPPETDPGVVFASGNAATNSLIEGLYSSATRTVRVALINVTGFASGEFATVICDLAPGAAPTAGDFTVQAAAVSGLYSTATITGATVTVSVILE